jgi:hypothetical protein
MEIRDAGASRNDRQYRGARNPHLPALTPTAHPPRDSPHGTQQAAHLNDELHPAMHRLPFSPIGGNMPQRPKKQRSAVSSRELSS